MTLPTPSAAPTPSGASAPPKAPPRTPPVVSAVAREQLRGVGWADHGIDLDVDFSGPLDPPLSGETAVQALCGIMHVHGRAGGRPRPLAVDYASTVAGVLAAQGVLGASIARARGARIDAVRTSAAEAALLSVQQYLAVAAADDADSGGTVPSTGRTCQPGATAARPPFTSRDGVHFELETLKPECWQRFWNALGAPEKVISRGWWPFQQRFATARCDLPVGLHEAVGDFDYGQLRTTADRSGVSVVPVRELATPPERIPACTLAELPGADPRTFPAPAAPSSDGLQSDGLPLDGMVVVESTRRVQGPLAGHVLRLLGADVVRVEPPGGDPMRGVEPVVGDVSARYSALNAGKRVVELDIKSAADRDQLRDLVSRADVFLHNWAPGKAEQLELDAEALARVRPGLTHAWASGWGCALGIDPPVGTDYLVQAHSGLAAALSTGAPPEPSLMTLTDVLGGLVCAQGVLASLLRRARTGRGCRVRTSLLSAAGIVPRRSAPRSVLRTADGFVALPGGSRDRAAAVLGRCPASGPEELDEVSSREPTSSAVARFADAGVTATPVHDDLRALLTDPRMRGAISRDGGSATVFPWEFS